MPSSNQLLVGLVVHTTVEVHDHIGRKTILGETILAQIDALPDGI